MTANQMTCPKCGRPVTHGMKFCETCGAKIEALPACTKCGAPLAPDVKFCETCGTPVAPAAALAKTAMEEAVPVAAPVSPGPETVPIQETPPPAKPPVKAIPAEVAPVAAAAAATVSLAYDSAGVKEVRSPAEPAVKAEEKPVPAPEKKPASAPAMGIEPPKTGKVNAVPKEAGPKKPMSSQTMIIAGVIVLALLGAAVYFVVLPMLSGPGTASQTPTITPVTTSSGSSSVTPVPTVYTSQTSSVSLTAGPTQVPPTNLGLIIDVERDAISHMITVTFQGGEGQYGVRELVVTLTKSDGTVETKSFKPEYRGTFITVKGTEKTDRVEITANYYNGESYKVVDQIFEYKKRTGSP